MKWTRVVMLVAWCVATATSTSFARAQRVALMDFSTDENSYPSIQAAANFASLVQLGLMNEAEIEWVERAQISLAKQEFGLAGLKAAGENSLRQGRMVGADWLVTGHFSSDDQNRSTLSVQVIELKHADVIAAETVTLPSEGKGWVALEHDQISFAVGTLQSLFAKARIRQREVVNQARVAFLFLADTSRWAGSHEGTEILSRELSDELERAAATNGKIRLIRFPKAYQSTGESELAVDGILASGQDSWSRTADLYVWGTYSVTNARTAGRMDSRLDLMLNLWDGTSQPITRTESLNFASLGNLPPQQVGELIKRLVGQVVAKARPQQVEADSSVVRRQIAAAIVKSYLGMTGRGQPPVGVYDREKLVQAVQMLETACYFDPDNAEARVLWVTCRYGRWVDFGFNVKNQFWTKWRRSQAWGKYVDRFGLEPSTVELPFPYQQRGIPDTYVKSLEDAQSAFPQWPSAEEMKLEKQYQLQKVHTWLVEAELHGFPKEMPLELAMKWKTEVDRELAQRKKRAAEFSQAQASTKALPAKAVVRPAVVNSNQAGPGSTAKPSRPLSVPSSQGVSQMVPAPAWLKQYMSFIRMFQISPPNMQTNEVKPEMQPIRFPPSYEVKVIRQLAYHRGRLWILAMDERSSPSSDATPDLSSETVDKRNRLWSVEMEGTKPELFKADSLPARINSFLFQDDQLWLAGDSVGVLDLKRQSFRKFGFAEGMAMQQVEALALAGGRLFAAGDAFKLSCFDPVASRWGDLLLPKVTLSHGSGRSYMLAGNQRWLAYGAGSTLLRDTATGTWTNLANIKLAESFVFDDSTCWIGDDNGLHSYATDSRILRSWNAPVSVQSPMLGVGSSGYFGGNQAIRQDQLDQLAGQIHSRLARLQSDHRQRRAEVQNQQPARDPFAMTSRIPGAVAALANDGDFLWLGVGNKLLLLHKPSLAFVTSCTLGDRHRIASLAVSDTYVWVGTTYGDSSLVRLRKDAFLSVPRSQWVGLTITPEERERLLRGMSPRGQALYAFFTGDDERVAQLLGNADPSKASLEEMFLLAWSHDASGVDDAQKAKAWFERIAARHPDSPWADFAHEAITENEVRHSEKQLQQKGLAQFDRNRDGVLDAAETRIMTKDPSYAREQNAVSVKQTSLEMAQVVRRYDENGDGKLDESELNNMTRMIKTLLRVEREAPQMVDRNRLLTPLTSELATAATEILKRHDANKDGKMSAEELSTLALEIAKRKKS